MRANMMARNVFYPHWVAEAHRGGVQQISIPTDQGVAPYLAEKPRGRVMAFVQQYGAGLTPSRSAKVSSGMLLAAAGCSHRLFGRWKAWKVFHRDSDARALSA